MWRVYAFVRRASLLGRTRLVVLDRQLLVLFRWRVTVLLVLVGSYA